MLFSYHNNRIKTVLYACLIVVGIFLLFTRPYISEAVKSNRLEPFYLLIVPIMFALICVSCFVHNLILMFFYKEARFRVFLPIIVGFLIAALFIPGSVREYKVRSFPGPMDIEFYNSMFLFHLHLYLNLLYVVSFLY